MIKPLALLAVVAFPLTLESQTLGGGLGWWTTTGGRNSEVAAHGVRVHGTLGLTLAGVPTDLEGAFSQAAFNRSFAAGDARVNENSIEIASLMRVRRGRASWWPYAGPVASVGIGCGTAGNNDPNGKVACDSEARSEGSVRFGVAAGLALSRPVGALSLTTDVRLQVNTIASARGSGPVLLVALGLRQR